MEQGTTEWHTWRRQGIGASESATLLGLDPYGGTPFKLWRAKTEGAMDKDDNAALFQRGHETEAMVRAAYEFETGLDFGPAVFEHPEYPFIRASLDGWNEAERRGIEVKMVGKKAMGEPIPPHHLVQVQHQMLVTATDSWTYLRHCEGITQTFILQADLNLQRDILAACWQFWEHVQTSKAPAFTDLDWVPCDHDAVLAEAVQAWRAASTTKARAAERARLLALTPRKRCICDGVKICTDPARVTDTRKTQEAASEQPL